MASELKSLMIMFMEENRESFMRDVQIKEIREQSAREAACQTHTDKCRRKTTCNGGNDRHTRRRDRKLRDEDSLEHVLEKTWKKSLNIIKALNGLLPNIRGP